MAQWTAIRLFHPKKQISLDLLTLAKTLWQMPDQSQIFVFGRRTLCYLYCSVKITTLMGLVIMCVLSAGCMHSKRTYIQVVDGLSNEPLASAKITASLYDPLHPGSQRTCIREELTRSNGLAVVRIPMCSTRGVQGGYLYEGGCFVGRGNPNSMAGPELIVEKEGYVWKAIYNSNRDWQTKDTSRESPFVVELRRNRTEPGGAANAASPHR